MTIVKEENKKTAELLVELYCEEIPWKLQEPMARNLERFLQEELAKSLGLKKRGEEEVFGERRVYWTPRRVAVGIADVPVKSEAWEEERRGPRVNAPQVAIDGFLRKNGLSLEDCQRQGDYWTFTIKHAALSTSDLLGEVVVRVIRKMSKALPVGMRFAEQRFRWVRPCRHIMVVFAGRGVTGALALGNGDKLAFTHETRGHPFAAPDAIVVTGIQDYEEKLREAYVEPSYQDRYKKILIAVAGSPADNYQVNYPREHRLVQENACLTEYPVILKGHFDKEFANLPSILINEVINEHQKMIRNTKFESGDDEFFVIANTPHVIKEKEKNSIVKGFERVVRARLADATFMLQRDKKTPPQELIDRLKNITFHPNLGTIADKNQRTKQLIPIILEALKNNNDRFSLDKRCDSVWFERQVDELKLDLATETVREFPSLHKVIGRELIGSEIEPKILPAHAIVDIADNIDSLVALWGAGEKPTGSGDPFALRRQALAVIFPLAISRPLGNIHLPLEGIIKEALGALFFKDPTDNTLFTIVKDSRLMEIVSFMLERLRVFLKDHEQFPHDCIEAVLTHKEAQECNIYLLYHRTFYLAAEKRSGRPLAEIFHRLHAILRAAPYDLSSLSSPPSPNLFSTTEEKNLYARTQSLADKAWQNLTFREKLQKLGSLKDAIDPFFEHVLVMHKDERIRQNRLSLLYSIYERFWELADFTEIHHKDKQQKHTQQQA